MDFAAWIHLELHYNRNQAYAVTFNAETLWNTAVSRSFEIVHVLRIKDRALQNRVIPSSIQSVITLESEKILMWMQIVLLQLITTVTGPTTYVRRTFVVEQRNASDAVKYR